MKILVVCQYYKPEPFRISDICEELVRRGHMVTVVTGTPNYPMGQIYNGYQEGAKQDEVVNGVIVHRCKIHPRKTGSIHRLWNYYSYTWASKEYVSKLDDSFDLVFVNQLSPVMMAQAGIKYARKYKKRILLYCLDLWPASLAAGGIKGGLIYKWFRYESRKVYYSVDKILITSRSFASYFKTEFGINDTSYLPQYAEDIFIPEQCWKEPDEYIDLMFAGNVGAAQSVDTIIKAASLCRDIPNLRWHIVGDGKEIDNIKQLSSELKVPVFFHGRQPLDVMPKYYSRADAMLVTMQKDSAINMTLPGKVQTYMSAGKPIIGAIDGETNIVIQDAACGLVGCAEQPEELAKQVKTFVLLDTQERINMGKQASIYYKDYFSRDSFISRLEDVLGENDLVSK